MRRILVVYVLAAALVAGAAFGLARMDASWDGVDRGVVEKFAKQAGRVPREPLINTDQGDLLLFVFMVSGTAGGFLAGYCFRELFPPRRREGGSVEDV